MIESEFGYFLTLTDESGAVVHLEEIGDFLPCYEELLFTGVCAGQIPNNGRLPTATIEPVLMSDDHHLVTGMIMRLPPLSRQYSVAVFAHRVRDVLLERGLINRDPAGDGKNILWHIEAHPRRKERSSRLRASLKRSPFPFTTRTLDDLGVSRQIEQEGPFRLFVSGSLLEELCAESARSLGIERADILTGHLVGSSEGQAALVVTGRVPAVTETSASQAHFAFSPLTFVAAREAIAGSADGAVVCGWHHNHPPQCGENCLQNIPACGNETVFFSMADQTVHRASFPASWMIALVSGKESGKRADQPAVRAWGWSGGLIDEIKYSVF